MAIDQQQCLTLFTTENIQIMYNSATNIYPY